MIELVPYIRHFKQTLSSASTTPNVAIVLQEPYNIPDLNQIQLTIHAATLINCLNDDGTLGTIAKIWLKELQLHNWMLSDFLTQIAETKEQFPGKNY